MCAVHMALALLARRAAPHELDGLVVASTQAGHRQDRVLAHLRTSMRHEAPAQLGEQLGIGSGQILGDALRVTAPAVLDRLVDEELRDPDHALIRRYTSRLERLGPPASLRERVDALLASPRRSHGRGLVLGFTAFLVLVAAMWGWWALERENLRPRFQIVYANDLDQLDPLAREMLSGMSGGSSELVGKAAR
ncbi:MAG: hypothetical protein IPJ19_06710 [Planctomycetes bacterium]|nr:hypothetical protein [Planctomycetota bacterium]